jgi:DNA mismatch repair protein MutS2
LIPEKTRLDLEWDRVLHAVASRCRGAMGQAAALELEFASSAATTRACLAESAEATQALVDREPLPLDALPDVAEAVQRVSVGGVLAPQELRGIAQMLTAGRVLRRYLTQRRAQMPALFAACATDPTLDAIADELTEAFDPDGTLSDRASPELRQLRLDAQASRARIRSRLEDLMNRYERVLQERFITEREGRYVLPVRADAHERFAGLVHATSGSGSTIFVEPRAVIPMGNRLKMLEADILREEIVIYTRLSAVIADGLPSVKACRDAVARADVRAATARLAEELGLVFPEIVDAPRMDLRAARHPLLALDLPKEMVVPSDLAIEGGHAVIVSGPNAGGKTVALKTMGLAALMVRAGLPVACAVGSVVGMFEVVLTDVGDDQSLSKSLSTFSAHITNLTHILDATRPGALVLLDELAGGTDPREGEALAAGVLDSLCARGGAVVATTHYEGLKALALADARFQNASVGFDLATMNPTFRLAMGIPGSSSALAVARRFGMPSTVIERAQRFLSREDQNFETVVKRLNDERAALELARAAADAREREADAARVRLEAELEMAKSREARVVSREAENLLASLRRAKDDLRAAQARLRAKRVDEGALKEASRTIDRVASQVAIGGELEHLVAPAGAGETPRRPLRAEQIKKGMRVWVPRLRAHAEVLDISATGVRVAAGALKLTVAAEELREADEPMKTLRHDGPGSHASAPGSQASLSGSTRREVAMRTTDNTCDLRGLRVDDALSMAIQFLDRSLNEARQVAFLLHGHGTGALREVIRKELSTSPYVTYFRTGTQDEGGEGVTVVWLQ